MKKQEQNKAPVKADAKAKAKMLATKIEGDKRTEKLKKGAIAEPEQQPAEQPKQQQQQQIQQPTSRRPADNGHAKGCRCQECKANDIHPTDCMCTVCKRDRKKKGDKAVVENKPAATVESLNADRAAGIGTAKALAEAMNMPLHLIGQKMGKEPKACHYTPDQLQAIEDVSPIGEIPRSWPLSLGLSTLFAVGNIFMAPAAAVKKDVETLQTEMKDALATIEHLKTYAEQAKATITAQKTELQRIRKTPIIE